MVEKEKTIAITPPKTSSIQGKLYLETKLYKFALALENMSADSPLDLRGFTLFRKAIKDRLITKAQLGSAQLSPRGQYKSVLRFTVPREYERRLQIFLTPQATDDINTIIRQIFLEMANSHVQRAIRNTGNKETARQAYLDFLNLYDLTEDDFDRETLQKSEYRLRITRNQPNIHEIKREKKA